RLEHSLDDLVEVAIECQESGVVGENSIGTGDDVRKRLMSFTSLFREHLPRLREEPNVYGGLTIRSLLNLREQCLRGLGFPDIFAKVKRIENKDSLKQLPALLKWIDAITDPSTQITELITNVLAGNMFDWGSASVLKLLREGSLDFNSAKSKIQ